MTTPTPPTSRRRGPTPTSHLVERAQARLAPAFDIAGGQRLGEVLVNLMIVGFSILLVVGMVEAVALRSPGAWIQPLATIGLIVWAALMQRRGRPRPVPLLMVSATLATSYLVAASLTESLTDVTNTSPVVMIVGAGAIAVATGGRRPLRTALYVGFLAIAAVIAIQTALDEHPMAIFAEAASSVVVIGLAYYLIRSVRVALDAGSTRYTGLLETAPVAVLEADLSKIGKGVPVGPVVRNLNLRAREILGVADLDLDSIDDQIVPPVFQQLIVDVVTNAASTGERVVVLEDGRALLVNWRALDRRFARVMFSGVDITSQQEAERSLAEQVRARDQFIATVSHELRTPLTGALGLLELLHAGEIEHEERDEAMLLALAQTRDMADIVQDLLVAARASSGGLVIKPETMALADLARSVVASVMGEFEFDVQNQAVVSADPVRVRQIVRNMATNAVRYGGSARSVRVCAAGGQGIIEVMDDGAPLDHHLQSRMFEPYERSGGLNLPTESVGLGLTVARMLARLMGGDLTYRHTGSSAIFALTLPLATESETVPA